MMETDKIKIKEHLPHRVKQTMQICDMDAGTLPSHYTGIALDEEGQPIKYLFVSRDGVAFLADESRVYTDVEINIALHSEA